MIEFDIKEESNRIDDENEKFWQQLEREEESIDYEKLQQENKMMFADMLRGELGEDIREVVEGRRKVKLPWKIKLKHWVQQIFRVFS